MKKRQRAPRVCVARTPEAPVDPATHKSHSIRFSLATIAVLLLSVIGAAATNTIYHGHVVVNNERTKSHAAGHSEANNRAASPKSDVKSAAGPSFPNPDFIAKYGPAAKSQLVAAAIQKVEMATGGTVSAKEAADRSEALSHGQWRPSASPIEAIMYGSVPPGMQPEQAALIYSAVPHLQQAPEPMTPDGIARMAGEPIEPMSMSQSQIRVQNDQIARSLMRERFGPIHMPPLQRDHQGSIREMTDNSGNIVAQYAYDPYGNATKLQGSMDSDFQYAGYYYHPRSGLSLTLNRAYSPVLGRFINRDPIGEEGGVNLYAYCENNPIGFHDPSGLQAYNKINNTEIVHDVTQVGAIESAVARGLSKDAVAAANASGLPGILHGPRNAYQHCLWSCLMAKSDQIGQVAAASIANNHEIAGQTLGQLPEDEEMDRTNNREGRIAAKCDKPCKDKCMEVLKSGRLVGRGGISVNLLYGPGF
ncbi:MAG: hypothetical protein JST01_23745 [Cyanobacteria bacterium SZAS TMP-1]|nr:hypothetical protein [Cyanobacteria bacterium SZAS TMP-1]